MLSEICSNSANLQTALFMRTIGQPLFNFLREKKNAKHFNLCSRGSTL